MTIVKSNVSEISKNIMQKASDLNIQGQMIFTKPTRLGAHLPNKP